MTWFVQPSLSFKRKHELQEELREPQNQSLSASSGGAKPPFGNATRQLLRVLVSFGLLYDDRIAARNDHREE